MARSGAAVRRRCVRAVGRRWTLCGVLLGGWGADGLRADAAAALDVRSGSEPRPAAWRRTLASSARSRCRPWVMRSRMRAVSVVPKWRRRSLISAVSVRRRIDTAAPSAQAMSSRMMKSRRRVEGVAQPALAPAGVVGRAEREAWAGILRNIILD